jgi:hypothetical protein
MSTTLLRGEFDSRLLREYFLDDAFDEMFTPDGGIRSHYAALLKVLSDLPTSSRGSSPAKSGIASSRA